MNIFKKNIRIVILLGIMLIVLILSFLRLFVFQIVQGEELLEKSVSNVIGVQEVAAPRGEIVDVNGKELVANKLSYDAIIEYALFPKDMQKQNELILKFTKLLKKENLKWEESLPVSKKKPYVFTKDGKVNFERKFSEVIEQLRLNKYATAENVIDSLIKKYEISDKYTDEEIRDIAGVRYEMGINLFSKNVRYTFIKNIPYQIAFKFKEIFFQFPGFDIAETPIRYYPNGTIFSHGLGSVGLLNREEYQANKSNGYKFNDYIGKSGIEKYMESTLRGENGKRSVALGVNNTIDSIDNIEEAIPGDTVKLTIDSEFQKKVQNILEKDIKWQNAHATKDEKGKKAFAGSVVVIDVKTGAVKAMVNYPTYDINDYSTNYSKLAADKTSPLINRALDGGYRPGSTFKTIVSIAGLTENIIEENTKIFCSGIYNNPSTYKPTCMKHHGSLNVKEALRESCNIFFYTVGEKLGIDRLTKYEKMFGFGTDLKFELGATQSKIASPERFKELGMVWTYGAIWQASIGQSEIAISPMNLAVQGMTLANNGKRYRPYIVDSVVSYDGKTVKKKTEPILEATIDDKNQDSFNIVRKGMKLVMGHYDNHPYLGHIQTRLPYTAAIKTGTPQQGNYENSAVVGYYPADNPEIAFGILQEKGYQSVRMVKPIINAYYNYNSVEY